jgi:hypothetical protein
MRPWPSRVQSGIALIEALIALAVMAFGMLAIVGMQGTLRGNSDLSRQRAEAVRLAQQQVEQARAYAVLVDPANPGAANSFNALSSRGLAAVPDVAGRFNTTFRLATVVPEGAGLPLLADNLPSLKGLSVTVTWKDRVNADQTISLSTAIHGVAPELAGTLSVPPNGTPTSSAGGRNRAIPWSAVPLGNNTSAFVPPQAYGGTVVWVFNNLTGVIQVCAIANLGVSITTSGNIVGCSAEQFELLSGYVNFASNASTQATAADALRPRGTAFPVAVQLLQTAPTAESTPACFTESPAFGQSALSYFCAVPVGTERVRPPWSGYSVVTGGLLPVTPTIGDFITCRYTSARGDVPAPSNSNHPRSYLDVVGPLTGQNFLVVRVVSGTDSDCPDGLPNGSTTYPQPQSAP